MFRRRSRFQDNPMAADQLALLIKANQLTASGKPLEAGPLFADVAEAMQRSNHPRRAANLYARAAHAFADGNNKQATLDYSRKALALLTQFKMIRRAPMFFANITRKMVDKGMNAASDALRREYGVQMPAQLVATQPANLQHRGILPISCPKCGAAVHSDSVDWVDDSTAECEYCGTLIQVEK
jgi:hypothetical protein